jgi:hypothetical protein
VADSREGVGSRVGVWHHALLLRARAPRRGNDRGVGNCGARGAPYRQELLLLQMPCPSIWTERGHVPWPHGNAECYGTCSDVSVPHAVGAPPPIQWSHHRRWAHPLHFPA